MYANKKIPRILLVDDDPEFRRTIEILLKKNKYEVIPAGGLRLAVELLESQKIDLIITDLKMADGSGMDLLATAKKTHSEVAVIILTAYGSIRNAVEAMRRGAFYYISKTKPFQNDELLVLIEKAIEDRNLREELTVLREEIAWKYGFDSLIGVSPAMKQLKSLANRVAASDFVILITGESGTGKELLAKAIHYHSDRRKKKFIPIECTSIPENLLESEFFGHVKGSFTSAYQSRRGLFEEADGGTVFLDEVGDMPITLQAKILRVLQESEIRPVGSSHAKKIDVRVITATNRNLAEMVKQEKFREDLFYRLNVLPIQIPPLRKRIDDIPVLTEHFLKIESSKEKNIRYSVTSDALQKLLDHYWPGNVRELENTVKRAVALSRDGRIRIEDIFFITSDEQPVAVRNQTGPDAAETGTLEESLRQRIETTLYANNWNLTRTAIKLGIGRTTLWRKIKKYDIKKSEKISGNK
jgi:DNA-binding NtrC family response regulator